jgi:choline dehydrogenase-like flavoprotein
MDHYDRMAGMFINGEDMPRATNRITLNSAVKDKFGIPVANIHVDDHENDTAMRAHAQRQGRAVYEAVGALRTATSRQTPATHNMCTARMSKNPRDGVTDAHGRAHDVPNLFISDGSALSTPGSANPTLTIVALALRQAEHIARGLSTRNL